MRCNAGRSDRQPTQQTCVLRYLLLYPSNRIHRHNVVPDFSGTAIRELGRIRRAVNRSHRRLSRSRLTPAIHLTITGSSRYSNWWGSTVVVCVQIELTQKSCFYQSAGIQLNIYNSLISCRRFFLSSLFSRTYLSRVVSTER